jgi:carboxy-terminal domain RNA polymerase II polypeptide A small phosphatase
MDSQRLLVIFDLDETLIHASESVQGEQTDFRSGSHNCIIRPFALSLVEECALRYDIAVWTSAGAEHAEAVVSAVFPDPSTLKFVWTTEQCTQRRDPLTYGLVELKDLSKVRRTGRTLERTLAIDDSPEKHERNYGNLLRVKAWTGDPDDSELLDVAKYLRWIDQFDNVRKVEKRGWRTMTAWQQQ